MGKQDTQLLQYWLKEVITTPGALPQKLQQAKNSYGIDETDVVAEKGRASVYDRLNVYSSGYVLRLLECLSVDFPVLRKFVGEEVFDGFARASLTFGPPVSYTLYDLGKRFITFLEATRPPLADSPLIDLPIELARLERAKHEAIRAQGTESNNEQLWEVDLEMMFDPGAITVDVPGCLRLLQLKFPLKDLFRDILAEKEYSLPQPAETFMAVSRKNYRVTIEELTGWQYQFLEACSRQCSLLKAAETTAARTGTPISSLLADLYIWLPVFIDNGFITCTRLQSPSA